MKEVVAKMSLIDNLMKFKTIENENIVEDLIECIENENIENLDQLSMLEDKFFTIDNKILDSEQRIKYCIIGFERSYYDYDGLSLQEIKTIKNFKDDIKKDINNEEKILKIIRINSMTNRELMFVRKAYDFIIDGIL